MGTILNDDTVAGIVALSELNPVMIVDSMSWFVSDGNSPSDHEHVDHDKLDHHESDHARLQSPLALATNVSRTALRTGSFSRLLSEAPVQASPLASGALQRRTTPLPTLKKSAAMLARLDEIPELTASIQAEKNSELENLEMLFAEPELLQLLWRRDG